MGGYLSLRQIAWLSLPLIGFVYGFAIKRGYIARTTEGINVSTGGIILRIIIILILALVAVVMSFVKVKQINADKYLFKLILYKLRKHTYIYGR